nr:unnamed protein product [Callosobruchus analis]
MAVVTSKRVITFSAIEEFFKNDMSQLPRGENSYESGNLLKMLFDAEVSAARLRGEVSVSSKKRNYTVEISYDFDDEILTAKCTCPVKQYVIIWLHFASMLTIMLV